MSKIDLVDAIAELRAELSRAVDKRPEADLKFDVNEIELELSVAMERSGGPQGKLSINVLGLEGEIGADANFSKARTQVIKLKLKPRGPNGDVQVSGTARNLPTD